MDAMTFADAQHSLGDVMDRVIYDRVEVIVTRDDRKAVVLMSLDSYTALLSTLSDGKGANETTALERYNQSFQAVRRGA